jgi:hypothetical protein
MESILADMDRALDAGASYAALATAVTLPEICGRCELRDMRPRKGQNRGDAVFNRFVNDYLSGWSIGLNGEDLYNLRNGLSHRGQRDSGDSNVRYVFTPPLPTGSQIHNNRAYRTNANGNLELVRLNIDLRRFCADIAGAVRRWMVANAENPIVQHNLENVLQPREGDFGTGIVIGGLHWIA